MFRCNLPSHFAHGIRQAGSVSAISWVRRGAIDRCALRTPVCRAASAAHRCRRGAAVGGRTRRSIWARKVKPPQARCCSRMACRSAVTMSTDEERAGVVRCSRLAGREIVNPHRMTICGNRSTNVEPIDPAAPVTGWHHRPCTGGPMPAPLEPWCRIADRYAGDGSRGAELFLLGRSSSAGPRGLIVAVVPVQTRASLSLQAPLSGGTRVWTDQRSTWWCCSCWSRWRCALYVISSWRPVLLIPLTFALFTSVAGVRVVGGLRSSSLPMLAALAWVRACHRGADRQPALLNAPVSSLPRWPAISSRRRDPIRLASRWPRCGTMCAATGQLWRRCGGPVSQWTPSQKSVLSWR